MQKKSKKNRKTNNKKQWKKTLQNYAKKYILFYNRSTSLIQRASEVKNGVNQDSGDSIKIMLRIGSGCDSSLADIPVDNVRRKNMDKLQKFELVSRMATAQRIETENGPIILDNSEIKMILSEVLEKHFRKNHFDDKRIWSIMPGKMIQELEEIKQKTAKNEKLDKQ